MRKIHILAVNGAHPLLSKKKGMDGFSLFYKVQTANYEPHSEFPKGYSNFRLFYSLQFLTRMADLFSRELRSYTMSRIRKTNTKPEILVRSFLFREGYRFRVHVRKLIGNPDIVLPKLKTIIFVNGCFWHAHSGCKYNRLPKTRREYWVPKILRNASRDSNNKKQLSALGWDVLTIWECDLDKEKKTDTLTNLLSYLKSKN